MYSSPVVPHADTQSFIQLPPHWDQREQNKRPSLAPGSVGLHSTTHLLEGWGAGSRDGAHCSWTGMAGKRPGCGEESGIWRIVQVGGTEKSIAHSAYPEARGQDNYGRCK